MTLRLIERIIWETFQWVALFGGLLGLLSGVLLIVNSQLFFGFSARMNTWISTRQAMRPLETPIDIERAVYRSHRIIGALILAGALYTLYVVALRFKGPELSFVMAKFFRIEIARWIGQSLRIFLIVVNTAAVVIATMMIVRPSALKPIEAWANKQYSGRQATRAWEIPRAGADPIAQAYPRLMGIVLILAGAYVLAVLGYARFVGH